MIDRRKRSKTLSEVKLIEDTSGNPQSFLEISQCLHGKSSGCTVIRTCGKLYVCGLNCEFGPYTVIKCIFIFCNENKVT